MSWLLLLVSYLLGATPTSHIAGKLSGIDLRQHGSGNLGATNTFRVLGAAVAAPVLVVDVLKGWVPAAYFHRIDGQSAASWALLYGAAAIVGHVYSIFVRFRGGKGVATSTGVFLALAPLAVALGAVVWMGLVWTTRIVSVASIAGALVLPTAVYFTQGDDAVFWFAVALAVFVVYAHRANIRRLLRGEEHRFRKEAR